MRKTVQPLTLGDLESAIGRTGSYELVRGEVVELSPGGLDHSRTTARILFALEAWARASQGGRAFTNEVGLITERDPDTVRGADIVYYSYARLPKGNDQGFSHVPPELAVEVWGRGQSWAELHEKAAEYLRMGVDRVWLVDGDRRRVHVLGRERPPEQFGSGDVLRDSSVLPGFELPVADIFED